MRVTSATQRHARKKKLLKLAKGLRGRKGTCVNLAKEYVFKREINKYIGAKRRKRDMRSLWILRINAAFRELGLNYSNGINLLKNSGCLLNRKILADLAATKNELFQQIVKKAQNSVK